MHADNYATFGARKMNVTRDRPEKAAEHGTGHVTRCTVERLMRDLGVCRSRQARSPRTTRWAPREARLTDLVNRHFAAL